jgi:hypothetical protein
MPRISKRTLITAARRDYNKLDRAYHAAGKKALGKPKKSGVHKDYVALKRARNSAGRKLGKLTGIR